MNIKEFEEIKVLSKKFSSAVKTICRNDNALKNNKKIISHFSKTLNTFPRNDGAFSKMFKAWDKKNTSPDIQHLKPYMFHEALSVLEPHLESLGFFWDGINSFSKTHISPINNNRLNGLIGVWKGYSWNKEETEKNSKPYYNVFRVEILENRKVKCQTKNAVFGTGIIGIIGTDRLIIEVSKPERKAYFTGSIGLTENLSALTALSFTYTDTSNDHPAKCGLAVFKKTSLSFEEIEIRAMEENEINEPEILVKLKGQQISAVAF